MEQYKEINGISYTLVGDYYLPNLLPHQEAERPVGVWGRRRMDYLKQHRRVLFTNLLTSGGLNAYLADTDERVRENVFPAGGADGGQRGRHGGIEGQRSTGLGRSDEQHRRPRAGDSL